MADLKTLSTIDTSPFKRLVLNLGAAPTAFTEGMTYYELLAWLVNFLDKEVIPKTNENIEAVKELQTYVSTYFDNLDVQEEINNKLDQMAEDGTLQAIITTYLQSSGVLAYDTVANMINATNYIEGSVCKTCGLNTYNDGKGRFYRIRLLTSGDNIDGVNIIALTNSETLIAELLPEDYLEVIADHTPKILANSNIAIEGAALNPLLMMKKFIGGTTGDAYLIQGIAANYNADHTINHIYLWTSKNDNTASRLYIATCGNRSNGAGWSYTYSDNVPAVHGSTICYKDGYLYIPNETENLNQQLIKYNIAEDTYTYIDLSSIMEMCGGIRYDEISGNFLLNTDNSTMYVTDDEFNLIRSYTHTNTSTINTYQGYEFYNNKEYRTMSTVNGNFIYIFSTLTGNLQQVVSIGHSNGEIESIDLHDGIALLAYNDFNPALNSMNTNMICEAFIGSWLNANDVAAALEVRTGFFNRSLAPTSRDYTELETMFCNNHDNSEIIRYVGNGTTNNPFSSAIACTSSWYEQASLAQNITIKVKLSATGTCTDDTSLRFTYIPGNVSSIEFRGNNFTLHGSLWIQKFDGCCTLRDIKLDASNNDRESGALTVYLASIVDFGGSQHTCTKCDIGYCNNVYAWGHITATGNITVQKVIMTQGYGFVFVAGGTITKNDNIYPA